MMLFIFLHGDGLPVKNPDFIGGRLYVLELTYTVE
jgi:hypothetical protein